MQLKISAAKSSKMACIKCNQPFETRKKGFKRKLVSKLPIPLIKLNDILDKKITLPLTPSSKFICNDCASLTVSIYKHDTAKCSSNIATATKPVSPHKHKAKRKFSFTPLKVVKRKCLTSTPLKSSKHSNLKKEGFKEQVYKYIMDSHYEYAYRLLLRKSKTARDALVRVLKLSIKKEVKSVNIPSLKRPTNLKSFETFSWDSAMHEASCGMPLLTGVLQGALSCRRAKNAEINDMGKLGSLVPVLGFILGTILYLHKPQQYNFLQTIISIEMYRSGCSQKLFRWFQKLGWSKGVKGTRIAADKICSEFDQKIVSWKNEIQVELGMPEPPQQPLNVDFESSDTDSSHNSLASSGSEITNQDSSDVDFSSEDESDIVPLPFDDSLLDEPEADEQNPGYSVCWDNVQKLSMTRHHLRQENKMMLWALCFAAKNRISFRDLDTVDNTFSVTDIGLQNYLPSDTDWRILRSRMEHLVQKIVQVYFPQFSEMDVKDTPHQYTQQSQKKSEIVNLGVLQENPSTARGVLEILKYLHKYVPIGQDRNPYQILCHGDQLSVERMVEAKLSMAFSEDAEDQLTGLVPRPQGFHKRCIILQDSMNMLFSGSTVGDKGSLCHIKNKFTFRSVKKKISDCVNSVVDFFNFVTEGCVCLIICKLLNIKNIDELSNLVPDDDKERQDMFVDLCKQVVQLSWPLIDTQSIQEVVVGEAAEDVQYHDDTIIYWDNNQILEDTLPYHEDSDNDFVDEPVVAHQESGDSVYQYSRSMLWRGLLHMAQTHAERTNNGDHIISDWRMDMVQFWNHNHNKYLILGHRLLGGVSGCLPPRLRNEVIWNSTANLTGKPGHNIALDLVNEFLNNEFKSNLKNSHGQYTDAQVSRCSHLVGSVGKSIEDIFQSDIIQDYIPKATTTDGSSRPKIKKFIDEYSGENLFEDDGERHHTGFENFEHKVGVNNPEKLKARLQKYGKSMENEEYIFKNI